MEEDCVDLLEKIERCRRLAKFLTDDEMRDALNELAEDYEARLDRRTCKPFMLSDRSRHR